jgi:Tfp pilus assembly protein PilO
MKFRKLPKEKRNHLILVVIGTLAVLSALGFGLIKAQYDGLNQVAIREESARAKLKEMEEAVKRKQLVESVHNQASQLLNEKEASMAADDLYSWMYNTVRRFQKNYKIEIPQLSPISAPSAVNLLPDVPYKQATMQIGGTAHYHDLGQFVADFENAFPQMRIANLTIEFSQGSTAPSDREKLAFKMDLITLVKSSQP